MSRHFNPYLEGLGDLPVPDLIALVHSAVGANETYELEWKLEFPLETRMRRAALAKHIIAFANRDPDRAARTFKGHAFLLIGVEPGAWGSAPDLDPAELVQQLEPFTVRTGLGIRSTPSARDTACWSSSSIHLAGVIRSIASLVGLRMTTVGRRSRPAPSSCGSLVSVDRQTTLN